MHELAKTGRSFTRFSIKSILQDPVYLIADKDAYPYFVDNEAELFAPESDFDGVRGVLAYNRNDQEKGRATVYNPINEWIVSVGEHPGIISSNRWIRVQESLERNKSKSYHKSRGNEALLTGLLWCSCGSRMYPKVTGRKTADGRVFFSYMCKLKERSRRELCSVSNANGNLLDAAICEQVKHLADHSSDFMKQLEKAKSAHAGNRSECETKLSALRKEQAETQRKITALYGIPVEDILDDYTLFLHRGGGDFLRRYREAKGWSRQQLADHAKVSRTSIRCWESGQKTISQKCFCHLVENLGSDFPSMLRM